MSTTVALVESPSQLLNVIEWSFAHGRPDELHIAMLMPADELTRRQLFAMAELARSSGVRVQRYEVRSGTRLLLATAGPLLAQLLRARRVVVGDPFSRFIQTILPIGTVDDVVIVDDGTATLEYAACIAGGRPLVRWHAAAAPSAPAPLVASRATRLLSPRPGRPLTVFSAFAGAAPAGATALDNTFAWTRARFRPEVVPGQVDLVGASLVETGVVQRGAYVQAVVDLTGRHNVTRYLAHRRESADKLAEIAGRTGLDIVRPYLPVELTLAQGPVGSEVISFPSTTAHTLPLVLAGRGVVTHVQRLHPSWFEPSASPRARRFVERVTGEARLCYALDAG